MFKLKEEYNISWYDVILCKLFKILKIGKPFPKYIRKRSYKKYGRDDRLLRYWYNLYCDVVVGKYTYGFEHITHYNVIKSIGSFSSIAKIYI